MKELKTKKSAEGARVKERVMLCRVLQSICCGRV